MRDIEMYEGFDQNKQQEYEKYMVDAGIITQREIDESWRNVHYWKKDNWSQFQKEGEVLNLELAQVMKANLKPSDVTVQNLIGRHYDWVKHFWTPTKDSYMGLAQMYLDHPDYQAFYNRYHPDLVIYLVEAMKCFIKNQLS